MKTDPDLSIKLKLNSRPNDGVFVPTIPRAPEPKAGDILWGRIVIALVLVFALLAGLIWGGWRLLASPAPDESAIEMPAPTLDIDRSSDIDNSSKLDKSSLDAAPVDVAVEQTSVVNDAPITVTTEPSMPEVAGSEIVKPESVEIVKPESVEIVKPESVEIVKPEIAAPVATLKTVEVASEVQTPPSKTVPSTTTAQTPLAAITIDSKNITQAVLSSGIDQRRPVDALPALLSMGDQTLLAVYFFTTYSHLKGQTLYHDWYRNGQRMARVKSRPSSAQVEVYSSKFIDQHLVGPWQVKVVNHTGKVLAEGRFEVKP